MRNITMYNANVTLTSIDAAYVILTNMTCLASMCGCLIIIGLYLAYPDIRTTARKLMVCLGVANFLQCVAGLLQGITYFRSLKFPDERKFICESAASVYVMGQVASALWTCTVTVYLFLCVSLRIVAIANRLVYFFFVFSFTMPMLVAIAAGSSDVYGYDVTDILYFDHPTVCWISDRVSNTLEWGFITVEGWVIATYFLSMVLFLAINCSIVCQARKQKAVKGVRQRSDSTDDATEDMAVQTATKQLRYVPLIYCVLRLWGTAHFLFTEYPTKRHLRAFDWLILIRAFGDNSQGLANCVLFCCTTAKVRRMVARRSRKWCNCCATWCRKQQRRLEEERWVPKPIVRMSRALGGGFSSVGGGARARMQRSLDGSDVDISNISLELPSAIEGEELIEMKNEEDVLFERQ